jgi:hypothetical protein
MIWFSGQETLAGNQIKSLPKTSVLPDSYYTLSAFIPAIPNVACSEKKV